MSSSWLPTWLGLAWTMVFLVVLAVHLGHLWSMRGRARAWHAAHVLMALGMVDMYRPAERMLIGRVGGVAVFTAAAVLVAVLALVDGVRNGRWNRLWAVSAVDLALMAWMFQMMQTRVQVVTILATAWFVMETVGWATGRLLPAHDTTVQAATTAQPAGGVAEPAEPALSGGGVATMTRPAARQAEPGTAPDTGWHGRLHQLSLRITLPAMSLGMAYMFLATQYGGMAGAMGMGIPGM